MKKFIIFGILIFITGFANAQLIQFKTDTLRAIKALKVKDIDRTTFFDKLSTANETTTDAIGDSTITLQKLTQAAINYIGAETINNNPDDVTIENKSGSTLGIKADYIVDSLTVGDTTSLKAIGGEANRVMILRSLNGTTNPYGGGEFSVLDSTDVEGWYNTAVPDGGVIFAHPETDKLWVRNKFLQEGYIDPTWYGAFPDSSNFTATQAAFEQAVEQAYAFRQGDGKYFQNIPIIIPHGFFTIDDMVELRPGSYVRGQGRSTRIHQLGTTGSDPQFGEWQTTLLDDIDNNNYYIGYMYLTSDHPFLPIETKRPGTAGDGGLYLSGDKNPLNRVVVEYVDIYGSGLGIQIKLARDIVIDHCDVSYTDWVAITPVGAKISVTNCTGDRVAQFLELLGEVETTNGGSATTTGNSTTLYDGGQDWTADKWIQAGHRITNNTDGSEATIVSVDNDSTVTTTALTGGSDNTWESGDAYTHWQRYGNADSTVIVNISDNYFRGIKDYGAWIKNYTSVTFEGNHLYGVWPTPGDQFGVQFTTSQKVNSGSGYGNRKVHVYGSAIGNHIENFTVGIQVKGSDSPAFNDSLFHHVNIIGNTIVNMWTNGVLLEMDHSSFTEYGKCVIANNTVVNANYSGGSTSGSDYYLNKVTGINMHNNFNHSTHDVRFPSTVTTSGTGTANTDTLYDTNGNFLSYPWYFYANRAVAVTNSTDGSGADSIIAVINDTTLVTDELQGGSDNTWQSGDSYRFGSHSGVPLTVTGGSANNYIHDNMFTDPNFPSHYIYDGGAGNANNNIYENNQGLNNYDRQISFSGTYGYQHAWVDTLGSWIGGGGRTRRAVVNTFIDDTLQQIWYDQNQAVIDTLNPWRP